MSATREQRPSARIYQFPVRQRVQSAEAQELARIQSIMALPKAAAAALDGAWYHAEAVEKTAPGVRH
ncbi:MAG: DUF2735 domain-containing protein [Geminicoccaceae bacterium]